MQFKIFWKAIWDKVTFFYHNDKIYTTHSIHSLVLMYMYILTFNQKKRDTSPMPFEQDKWIVFLPTGINDSFHIEQQSFYTSSIEFCLKCATNNSESSLWKINSNVLSRHYSIWNFVAENKNSNKMFNEIKIDMSVVCCLLSVALSRPYFPRISHKMIIFISIQSNDDDDSNYKHTFLFVYRCAGTLTHPTLNNLAT